MIIYDAGPFGLGHLTRVHGSAVYRTVLPSLISTGLLLVFEQFRGDDDELIVGHPTAVSLFIALFSFLLTFRLNFAYQRYTEALTAIHLMISKWLDCSVNLAAFHYQSTSYDDIRPEAFGKKTDQPKSFEKKRHFHTLSMEETIQFIDDLAQEDEGGTEGGGGSSESWWKRNRQRRSTRATSLATHYQKEDLRRRKVGKSINVSTASAGELPRERIPIPMRFQAQFTKQMDHGEAMEDSSSNLRNQFRKQARQSTELMRSSRIPAPSMFLQEMAHLFSLLSAVALSTLRNDVEFAESPITEYFPGQSWPPVDPDTLSKDIQKKYEMESPFWRGVYFCLGLEDSPEFRTLYNAARPFAVLGGVSDEEVRLLQRARGPHAKVSLVSMWLQEFISREHLAGSTGSIAPPIISRLYQFISDGTVGYNQARKVAYIPFPFPHGQAIAFFVLIVMLVFPLFNASYVLHLGFACFLNFFSVLCFLGLHEVARVLEEPFKTVPNDLPLQTFQAQFNEALVTVYAGFHPDSWWEPTKSQKLSYVTNSEREDEELRVDDLGPSADADQKPSAVPP